LFLGPYYYTLLRFTYLRSQQSLSLLPIEKSASREGEQVEKREGRRERESDGRSVAGVYFSILNP
jgi:hypothetical protein